MTEQELQEIEQRVEFAVQHAEYQYVVDNDIPALCTALREAWKRIAELEEQVDELYERL